MFCFYKITDRILHIHAKNITKTLNVCVLTFINIFSSLFSNIIFGMGDIVGHLVMKLSKLI